MDRQFFRCGLDLGGLSRETCPGRNHADTDQLALDDDKITFNAVAPGPAETPMTEQHYFGRTLRNYL